MKQKILWAIMALGAFISSCSSQSQGAEEVQTLTILQTADIHGQLFPHDEMFVEGDSLVFKRLGGLAHVKTLFDRERAKNPGGTLILDGGDLIQGSGVAAVSEGQAFGPIVKAMDYDFLIPGNWEVVYGKDRMIEVLRSYETPVIAANMYEESEDERIFPPYFIKELKGVKLGFISYNDPEIPVRQNPSFSKGLRFEGIKSKLRSLIRELKDQEKVDILFLVTHIGISKQFDLSNDPDLAEVDYILGNDTHERIRKPLQGKYARVTEPGAFAAFVGKLTLQVQGGEIIGEDYQLMEVDPLAYPADEEVGAVIQAAVAPYQEEMGRVLGVSTQALYRYFVVENPMDNLITDAARWKTGADISLSNGFRFSPPIALNEKGVAPIRKSDLWNMLPVNERVKLAKASGKQIRQWLELELDHVFAQNLQDRFGGWLVRFSGMELAFYANRPRGERIATLKVGGKAIEEERYYTLSACRREGEPDHMLCRLPHTVDTQIMDYTVHDVVEEYLAAMDTVAPVIEGRATAIDLGDRVLSQLPGTDYHFH